MPTNLFGEEISEQTAHGTRPNGYADVPGKGPAGQTCKTCRHIVRIGRGKVYRKCGLARAMWSHGPGTDILASSFSTPSRRQSHERA